MSRVADKPLDSGFLGITQMKAVMSPRDVEQD